MDSETKGGKLARFGVSIEEGLLDSFDALCSQKGYGSRSEALRDLIRKAILEEDWQNETGMRYGTLTLVYDHHRHDLARKIMNIQHEDHDLIITTMHLHLDHDNCLEVLVLKGECVRVGKLAQTLVSCKGVKHGTFTPAPGGKDFS